MAFSVKNTFSSRVLCRSRAWMCLIFLSFLSFSLKLHIHLSILVEHSFTADWDTPCLVAPLGTHLCYWWTKNRPFAGRAPRPESSLVDCYTSIGWCWCSDVWHREQVRVNCLVCVGKILEHLDRWYVMDEVLPMLQQIPSREPAVLMSILGTIIIIIINVKKNCSLSTTYNGEMTHRKRQK